MILHPLSQVVIFAFVLSSVFSVKLPEIDNRYAYSIYLMVLAKAIINVTPETEEFAE